jgi:hypothetical protein
MEHVDEGRQQQGAEDLADRLHGEDGSEADGGQSLHDPVIPLERG